MKIIKKRHILLCWLLANFSIALTEAQSDTIVLPYPDFIEDIISFHPLSQSADLQLKEGEARMLAAKGNLDPRVTSEWNQKNFDDKLYYRQYQAQIEIPTPLGLDITGGYENTEGVFLNPENTTDEYGLWHAGLKLDILQGLFINERRTAIRQAEVFKELSANERQNLLNDLVYSASIAYFQWQREYYSRVVLQENTSIARTYFENTRQSFINGEKTGLDTLEAFILFQDATTALQQNEQQLTKARQQLENFLWFRNVAVVLEDGVIPQDITSQIWSPPGIPDAIYVENHPRIRTVLNKLEYAEIGQRLKREKLKPKLALKYHPLLATSADNVSPVYSVNDYKWGFEFSMPLLWRKERGEVQIGRIKIEEMKLDLLNKQNELTNKAENSYLQYVQLTEQLQLLEQNVANYERLLNGENELFRLGESSVFLLTKRQEKYILGRLKVIDTFIRRQLELLNYLYFTNQLIPA